MTIDIYVAADIHGALNPFFLHVLKHYKSCIIIVAGDIGIGYKPFNYYAKIFNTYQSLLKNKGIEILFIRGNHDDPKYFDNASFNYPNIKTIRDYTIIAEHILVIGGAVSPHREKIFSGEDIKKISTDILPLKITTIISHEAPSIIKPIYTPDTSISKTILAAIDTSREYLTSIHQLLHPLKWLYGHYHQYSSTTRNDTTFICIDKFGSGKSTEFIKISS